MSDYDLDTIRKKYIGMEFAASTGRYPVEYDPIRRHCHMVEDSNPLFLDPEYARNSHYGSVICPPSGWLAMYFASLGPWPAAFESLVPMVPTPGNRIVNMSQDVEWFHPIKIGDRLSVHRRVVDIYKKSISIDPEAIWIVSESTISNQKNEITCTVRNTLLTHRTPEEVAQSKMSNEK